MAKSGFVKDCIEAAHQCFREEISASDVKWKVVELKGKHNIKDPEVDCQSDSPLTGVRQDTGYRATPREKVSSPWRDQPCRRPEF